MKKILTLCLTAGLLLGAATGASAIDFKAKGQWIMGFGLVDTQYQGSTGDDTFAAQQRIRLQIDAIASESLSGTISFELGDTTWGNAGTGGALGADGKIVEVRNAYLDWIVPNTELSVRMGLQPLGLPNVAGGSAILDEMVAGIVTSYKINDMASVGFAWARPYNNNWNNGRQANGTRLEGYGDNSNFLDNIDLFTLFVPLKGDGWKVTPWLLGGAVGKNAIQSIAVGGDNQSNGNSAGYAGTGLIPVFATAADGAGYKNLMNDSGYGTAFFFGLPVGFSYDAWNFELDVNYGSITGLGDGKVAGKSVSLDRDGWLVKALFEYKMDWGTPGLFAWYASGDDGDRSNGSEMMPYFAPCGNFTSFIGDGNELGYSTYSSNSSAGYDQMLSYSGTWGIGLQLKQMSFVEDLSHTFRVAYWGGTNDTNMAKYVGAAAGGAFSGLGNNGFYLTTSDHLVEFNLDSTYSIYENLDAVLQLGYIINGVDGDVWDKYDGNDEKQNGYKVGLFFNYSF